MTEISDNIAFISPPRAEARNEFKGVSKPELDQLLSGCFNADDPAKSLVLYTAEGINFTNALKGRERNSLSCLLNLKRINDVRYINALFEDINKNLAEGGMFVGCVETYTLRKARILRKFPPVLNQLYYAVDFTIKRVFPKLPVLRHVYFFLTGGRNRCLSMAETFGRLYYAGFELLSYQVIGPNLYFKARKKHAVKNLQEPTYGPILKMKRVGKGGKMFDVYKVRTMHAYSEYLQAYVYDLNHLQEGGKIKNDFRITALGRYLRKTFIDELPMIINILRGEMKLVGVRPISSQYLSLYDRELRLMRRMVKPGLVPPFYADMPKTLDEIQASEKRYIRAYLQAPLRTDIIYFSKAFVNIVFKCARSA